MCTGGHDWLSPFDSGFRFRRSSSTCRGCSPQGHLPSSDLAVVVAQLPRLGHVAASDAAATAAPAAAAARLLSLDHVAVAAAAYLPSLDHVGAGAGAGAAAARLRSLDQAGAAAAVWFPSVQDNLSPNLPCYVRG